MIARLIVVFALLTTAFVTGWGVNGWRLNAKHDAETVAREQAATTVLASMTAQRDATSRLLALSNDDYQLRLRKVQHETTALRDCLRAGTCGLRIAANCTTTANTTTITADPSMGVGAGVELAEPARRAYFALRDGIDRTGAQLAACQNELKLRNDYVAK